VYEFGSEFACGLNVLIEAEYRCYYVKNVITKYSELSVEMRV